MRNSLLFCLFCYSLSFYAQKHEIGIAILNYSSTNGNYSFPDTVAYGKTKGTSIQAVLTYNYVTSKNIDVYAQFGFFYIPQDENYKTDGGSFYEYQKISTLRKSTYFKIGIAKRFEIGKLNLITGMNIPFEYNFYDVTKTSQLDYDKNANHLFLESTFYNKKAPLYTTGLNLHLSFYYNVFSYLSIGADLNLGYQTAISNGSQHYKKVYTYYDDPSQNVTIEQMIVQKHSTFNTLNFQPTVGIRYCFLKNKNAVVTP
jgi:hypothetical protein